MTNVYLSLMTYNSEGHIESVLGVFETLEKAQNACQIHYDARIRAYIDEQNQTTKPFSIEGGSAPSQPLDWSEEYSNGVYSVSANSDEILLYGHHDSVEIDGFEAPIWGAYAIARFEVQNG